MATINPTPQSTGVPGTTTIKWETLTENDSAAEHAPGGYEPAIGNVQVVGTFGGATVNFQGSNDGTNWVNLSDTQGTEISLTATGAADFSSAMLYFKPVAASGSSQDIDVIVNFRG